MASPEFGDAAHVGWMPVEMNGYDGFRSRADGVLQLRRVEAISLRLDIDKHGYRANHSDCRGRGAGSMGHGYDFVALLHVKRLQRQRKRVGTRCNAYGRGNAETGSQLLLEIGDKRSENVLAAIEDLCDGRQNLLPNGRDVRSPDRPMGCDLGRDPGRDLTGRFRPYLATPSGNTQTILHL